MSLGLSAPPAPTIDESIPPSSTELSLVALVFVFSASMLAYRVVTTPAVLSLWYAGRVFVPLSTALLPLSYLPIPGKGMLRGMAVALGVIGMVCLVFGSSH